MKNGDGSSGDTWLMVDDNGRKTLFQLVEMGTETEASRMARELAVPAIVVDVALPVLPADTEPVGPRREARSRLILLKVRTGTGDGTRVIRIGRPQPGRTGSSLEL